MNGVVLNDEGRAELAALRRRAFGPDADILDDPVALQRLRELEAFVLPPLAPVRRSGPDPPPAVELPVAVADLERFEEGDMAWPSAAPRPSEPLQQVVARLTRGRRAPIAAVLAAGVLIAAIGGVLGWEAAQPHPDRILAADATRYAPSGQGTDLWLKEMYGIGGAFHGHEPYGRVHVFTGTARNGSECMVLMIGTDDAVGTSCSPPPLPASTDLFILPGWSPAYTGLDLPAGSVVRFVQSGDDVEVWTAVMPTPPPAL